MTDLTEDVEHGNCLEKCIAVLSRSPYLPLSQESSIHCFMGAFQHTVQIASVAHTPPNNASCLIEESWKPVFWAECAKVVQALSAEKQLLKGSFTMWEWLNLRAVTISGEFHAIICYIVHPYPTLYSRYLQWI